MIDYQRYCQASPIQASGLVCSRGDADAGPRHRLANREYKGGKRYRYSPSGDLVASLLAIRVQSSRGSEQRKHVMAARHSGSIESSPNADPQTCSSRLIVRRGQGS